MLTRRKGEEGGVGKLYAMHFSRTFADFLESVGKGKGMHVSMAEKGGNVLCICEDVRMVSQMPTVQKDLVRLPSFLR